MTLTVAILGASGVYGRHLAPRLKARGHEVVALVRRPEGASALAACGAELRRADIFEAQSLAEGLAGCDLAVNLATDLPTPQEQSTPGGVERFSANDRLRRDGVPIFLQACRAAGVCRALQQSVALVNVDPSGALSDEDTCAEIPEDTVTGAAVAALRDMEAAVRQSQLDWLILRGAYFYGPGTGVDADWFARATAGRLRLPGDGSDHLSLVHIADMATATVAAIEAWPSGEALIVADDRPAPAAEVLGHVAALSAAPAPTAGGRGFGLPYRVSNRRIRERLGWSPAYPDYRVGLAS
jgi:nucleoside-diphosphate-sugar epimerase